MQKLWARERRGQHAELDVLLGNHARLVDDATDPGDSMERGANMAPSSYALTV